MNAEALQRDIRLQTSEKSDSQPQYQFGMFIDRVPTDNSLLGVDLLGAVDTPQKEMGSFSASLIDTPDSTATLSSSALLDDDVDFADGGEEFDL